MSNSNINPVDLFQKLLEDEDIQDFNEPKEEELTGLEGLEALADEMEARDEVEEAKEEVEGTDIIDDTKPAELIEEPELDAEEVSMEDGEKEPDKKKQDTMSEVEDKELEQLIDNKNEAVDSMDTRLKSLFAEDRVEVLQKKIDILSAQAKELERQQYRTKKSNRGYVLQQIYTEIDKAEKEIAGLKGGSGNSNRYESKESLHICNTCSKTFRNKVSECIYCNSKDVERIVEYDESDNPSNGWRAPDYDKESELSLLSIEKLIDEVYECGMSSGPEDVGYIDQDCLAIVIEEFRRRGREAVSYAINHFKNRFKNAEDGDMRIFCKKVVDALFATNESILKETKLEQQLRMGIGIEKEHTDNPEEAGKIAIDHLQEDPNYYTKLKKMEAGKCDESNPANYFSKSMLTKLYEAVDPDLQYISAGKAEFGSPAIFFKYETKPNYLIRVDDKEEAVELAQLVAKALRVRYVDIDPAEFELKKFGKTIEAAESDDTVDSRDVRKASKFLKNLHNESKKLKVVQRDDTLWNVLLEYDRVAGPFSTRLEANTIKEELTFKLNESNSPSDRVRIIIESWDNKSKLNEFEDNKDGYTTLSKGIADKDTADKLAQEKQGTVIQDEEDEKKFAVIKKTDESKVNEDARSTVIDAFYPHGYSLTFEVMDKDTGITTLTFTKGDEELKVQVMPTKVSRFESKG